MGVSKESRCGQIEVAIPGHLQAERRTMLRKGERRRIWSCVENAGTVLQPGARSRQSGFAA